MTSIGLVAPSSQVPAIELQLGIEKLKSAGFSVFSSPQVKKSDLFFSGTDRDRAAAFWKMAHSDRAEILWAARGGYGAARILPLLESFAKK